MRKSLKKRIYLDYAAGTPLDKGIYKAMEPYILNNFGNPSALYSEANAAKKALANARQEVAGCLKALPKNIIFTSGGTEANNLAIQGVVKAAKKARSHLITSVIEHHSVLDVVNNLETEGCLVTKIKVTPAGLVGVKDVVSAIKPETVLVSIMFANSEIGSVQPIAEIGRAILRYRQERNTIYPFWHVDACQAVGLFDLDVNKLHVDLMTINASKIYGPKGVGVLYARSGVPLKPIMQGGRQEWGLRPGTENVAGAVGLATALKLAVKNRIRDYKNLSILQSLFYSELSKKVPGARLNGPAFGPNRLPNNLNFLFSGIDGETLVLYLDAAGVSAATGSACATGEASGSYVLRALGRSEREARESVRFTMGRQTTKNDVIHAIQAITSALLIL
ncbi:MAG: cysteine desulfurase family protein [Candidatus Magasanikbacteria bacterium]|nr:cysteine desulfurase family protein [Candidatus Magasanikbacteria bacterium]